VVDSFLEPGFNLTPPGERPASIPPKGKKPHKIHETHSAGRGSRCSEPRMVAVTPNLSRVNCRRCIVMRQRGVEVEQAVVERQLLQVAHERAASFKYWP
jgi:hypothetical protein